MLTLFRLAPLPHAKVAGVMFSSSGSSNHQNHHHGGISITRQILPLVVQQALPEPPTPTINVFRIFIYHTMAITRRIWGDSCLSATPSLQLTGSCQAALVVVVCPFGYGSLIGWLLPLLLLLLFLPLVFSSPCDCYSFC